MDFEPVPMPEEAVLMPEEAVLMSEEPVLMPDETHEALALKVTKQALNAALTSILPPPLVKQKGCGDLRRVDADGDVVLDESFEANDDADGDARKRQRRENDLDEQAQPPKRFKSFNKYYGELINEFK